ncbi:segregation/condensation protein A [Patescibacteria group bacterium]|nr:segregation/condensation protein A [Patescibacteria group bacterium]
MYSIKTQKFNGPLDLLLQLIEEKKMEITDIALSEVTEQYLEYLEKLTDKDAEELSDFLVVAARLLLRKSRAILPMPEEEEELDDLEKQLKLYREFVEASKKVSALILQENFSFSRSKPPEKQIVEFSPPEKVSCDEMKKVFLSVLKKLDPLVKLPRQMIEKTVSLRQKILEIRDFLGQKKKFGFKELMKNAKNKTEVIMNFLAILELLKQQQLSVRQRNIFEDIMIEKI